jgi:hypothetical protein
MLLTITCVFASVSASASMSVRLCLVFLSPCREMRLQTRDWARHSNITNWRKSRCTSSKVIDIYLCVSVCECMSDVDQMYKYMSLYVCIRVRMCIPMY